MHSQNLNRDTLISAEENREMFDRIAQHYDAANRAISMGMDRVWRRKTVELLNPFRGGRYLDIGTGTGDLVFEILDQSANVLIDGIDPAEQMLEVARGKASKRGVGDAVSFFTADALDLPMEGETYDGIVSGFCFRNIEQRQKALEEMLRVLKPGGKLVILEATYPANAFIRLGYKLYMPLVPIIGKTLGGGSAYKYLVDSIEDFPKPETVTDMFSAAGFSGVQFKPLTFGTVCIFSGKKKQRMKRDNEIVFAGAPYSNSAPLVERLVEIDPRVRVITDHPANLLADLNAGRADVALIPVVHLFSHPELTMIDGLGIAANGSVKSVLLKCNVPVDQIKTVARDPASATSNMLAELLLKEHYGREIQMHDFQALEKPDAAVVIGDRALCSDPAPTGDIDLAEAWKEMTGLPFVFAVWAVRKDFPDIEAVTEIAHAACKAGLLSMEKIAACYAVELGNTQSFWLDYLGSSIHYELDERDLAGMNRFRELISMG
ncbi:MAG: bifunctional demethylmenaquinone methyltransferase/2-methoxy-6-polyprenyl-1,4-benzoquinol methylase UbiE [Verrucomicrobiota bacterium]